jgi:hypothetical protein
MTAKGLVLKGRIEANESENVARLISGNDVNLEVVANDERRELLIVLASSPSMVLSFALEEAKS